MVGGAVMDLGARAPGPLHAIAQADRLAGGDADDRLSQQTVEPRVPLPVAAEAGRNAVRDHREDAAERIATLARRIDGGHHRRAGLRTGPTYGGRLDSVPVDRRAGPASVRPN